MQLPSFRDLKIIFYDGGVAEIILDRPRKSNSLTPTMFDGFLKAFEFLDDCTSVRVVILKGEGKHFCSGIDLESLGQVMSRQEDSCDGRVREQLRRNIKAMQRAVSSIENCRKPVVAAVHGACVGAGVDLITACDFRYCSEDAFFSVKEVDLAITADLGTLQRLPKIVGDGIARELAITARNFSAEESVAMKLTNKCFTNKAILYEEVMSIAKAIAKKSPLAILGTKAVLLHSRDHGVSDSLEYTATWNSAMLISSDIQEVLQAQQQKRLPIFSKL